jgi:UDP-N-acetylmuramate: L-alanyl-gamma-D-glutamyl-meso-diaminopimelate ligase
MKLHILGICGTFMGSLAQLAKELGHQVSGSDTGVYPPMSDQLEAAGITLIEGFDPQGIPKDVDLVIVGNAMSRGNPSVEYVLDRGIAYTSGPQWLGDYVLRGRWVAAVAGTHGKTTTASMLAWILEYADMAPGYLIGGVPENFSVSARLGDSPFFVIEADEYDTAFFDKRSKFVHYHPRTLVLNNLEFDHADIFPDLAAIERQFHHLVRTVPATGQIIRPGAVAALARVEEMGCWTPVKTFAENEGDWRWHCISDDASEFDVLFEGKSYRVDWALTGQHNLTNAVASIAAARHMGVTPDIAAQALCEFRSVKRRMELVNPEQPIAVYDDFAHHPTAIQTTLQGAKASLSKSGKGRLLAVLEPRSNTMKLGHHRHELAASVNDADVSFWFQPESIEWSLEDVTAHCQQAASVYDDTERLIDAVVAEAQPGDRIVVMSNGGFQNVPRRIATALAKAEETSHA